MWKLTLKQILNVIKNLPLRIFNVELKAPVNKCDIISIMQRINKK